MNQEIQIPPNISPTDYFNFFGDIRDIFKNDKVVHEKSPTEFCYPNSDGLNVNQNETTFLITPQNQVSVLKNNPFGISAGITISKFMLLSYARFKGDYKAAESFVLYELMKIDVPYVRVGTDYIKITRKPNRYGGVDTVLKSWNKETLTSDHTKGIFKLIPCYDDFVIIPDNKNYARSSGSFYNLYAPFEHTPHPAQVSQSDIPHSMTVMKHIFGEQINLGFKYMKVLYDEPKQAMPVIVLVSRERGTGKTTFINWLQMIFTENLINITPDNLASQFNYIYATKNIIVVDETIVEKSAAEQKIKAITTAKTMSVNPKNIQGYSVPFFGKLIMCTNKVKNFMKIDKEENRFWIRYINPVKGIKKVKIEDDLFLEIPKFIKYLSQLPIVDTTHDRLVFKMEEIATEELKNVKDESKTWLHKELEVQIKDWFDNNDEDSFHATAIDIKKQWFDRDNTVKAYYIGSVIREEMDMRPLKNQRYYPFNNTDLGKERIGTPFLFRRNSEKLDKFDL